ncbi:MAG: hypothetical protein LAT76_09445 [Schleiferiaceae bacterium]|nr:hypothetical protein [Schleiferiaceae bacterium]
MNMKFFYLVLLNLSILTVSAQYNRFEDPEPSKEKMDKAGDKKTDKDSNFWNNLQYGGIFGAALGNVTFIEASPRVFANITEKDVLGIGSTYIYYNLRALNNFSNSIYGGQVFYSRVITETFFLHTEMEMLNLLPANQFNLAPEVRQREWAPGFYLGGGIRRKIDGMGFLYFYGLYNLLYDKNLSIQPSPWLIRVGVAF